MAEMKKYTFSRIITLAAKFERAAYAGNNTAAESAGTLYAIADKMRKANCSHVAAVIDTKHLAVHNYTLITTKAVDPRIEREYGKTTAARLTREEMEDFGMGAYTGNGWVTFTQK